MNYTEDDLLSLISRHDEFEGYYREKLRSLYAESAWSEGYYSGWSEAQEFVYNGFVDSPTKNPYTLGRPVHGPENCAVCGHCSDCATHDSSMNTTRPCDCEMSCTN